MVRHSLLVVLVLSALTATAQTNRYMVFFKDKAGTPHSISSPSSFLSARALQRRAKAGASVNSDDLPVTPSYVSQVKGTGAKTFFTSRWVNGVLVEATAAQLSLIQALGCVLSTEFVAPNNRLQGGRVAKRHTLTASSGVTDNQLAMHGLDAMHADGYLGTGVMVAVLDSGFPGVDTTTPFSELRTENRILHAIDFVTNSGNVYQLDDHGTQVLSVMVAKTTDFTGGAPEASYLLYLTEDDATEYRVEEYNWLFAAEQADSAGADIIQSSVGYATFDDPAMDYTTSMLDGNTAVITRAAANASARGMIVVASAGNLGSTPWQLVSPPADAAGILAVGAVTLDGVKASFSSIGPTSDGRTKPDLAAFGTGVSVITATGSMGTASGTSVAAPLVSSLVAGLLEAYPAMVPSELMESITRSSSQSASPDNQVGYGIPTYQAVQNFLASSTQVDVSIFPNPAMTELRVAFRSPPESKVDMAVYDTMGRLMEQASVQLTWANNPFPIQTELLSPGLYMLVLHVDGRRYAVRFVKL